MAGMEDVEVLEDEQKVQIMRLRHSSERLEVKTQRGLQRRWTLQQTHKH